MGWGGGHGNRAPETAKTVAKAFYAGRSCKRGNCETDGRTYWLEGSAIASRVPEDELAEQVARALQGKIYQYALAFNFAGYATQMTCRHLRALGVDAEIKRGHLFGPRGGVGEFYNVPCMNGRAVRSTGWVTPDEFNSGPRWRQPEYAILAAAVRREVEKYQQADLEFA
jgi:hypothetical protein